jgi:hypothetical protein
MQAPTIEMVDTTLAPTIFQSVPGRTFLSSEIIVHLAFRYFLEAQIYFRHFVFMISRIVRIKLC